MNLFAHLLAAFTVVALCMACAGWTDRFHVMIAAGLAAVVLMAWTLWRWRRPAKKPGRAGKRGAGATVVQHSLWGVLSGGTFTVVLTLVFFVLRQFPIQDVYYDWDRPQVSHTLTGLERKKHFEPAADVIAERLLWPLSAGWRRELQERRVRDLVLAGRESADPTRQQELWIEARDAARSYGVDDTAAIALLVQAKSGQAAADTLQKLRVVLTKVTDRIEACTKGSFFAQADELLGLMLELCPPTDVVKWRRLRLELRLAWAAATADLTERLALQKQTRLLASAHKWPPETLDAAIKQTQAALAALGPRPLPAGCTGRVLTVLFADGPPALLAEVEVNEAAGRMLGGLQDKDFVVVGPDGKRWQCQAAPVHESAGPLQIALVLDRSGSMAGEAWDAAGTAADQLVRELGPSASVSVFVFNGVTELLPASASSNLASSLKAIQATGGTALYAAVLAGLDHLATLQGPRALVLLTDGRDEAKGRIGDVLARARGLLIPIDVVALQTDKLDDASLKTLSSGTGGRLLTAERTGELSARFKEVALTLNRHCYRVVMPSIVSESGSTLVIGGANAVRLKVVLPKMSTVSNP